MTNTAIAERLDALTAAVQLMARQLGERLTHAQVCDRLDIHRNTLRRYIAEKGFPTPGQDGKWLLEEVIAWEVRK